MLLRLHLILPAVLFYTTASRSERDGYDPYISCDGPALTHGHGLPSAYSEATYNSALALCSVAHGAPRNVGCSCISSGGRVHCDEDVADSILFNAVFGMAQITIAEYCSRFSCYCRTIDDVHKNVSRTPSGVASPTRGTILPSRIVVPQYDPTGPNPFRDIADAPQASSQCGLGCVNDDDCQSCAADPVTADKYSCRAAQQSQFNPTTGAATFISMCLIASSTRVQSQKYGGKRDLALPCPCNSTYINHGCCGATGGVVWEPTGSNLGRLVDGD